MSGSKTTLEAARSDEVLPVVLAVDDQPQIIDALNILLGAANFRLVGANSPQSALDLVRSRSFDAILMDLNYSRDTTSGQEGMELL